MVQSIIEKYCYILSAKPQQIKQKCSKAYISSSNIKQQLDSFSPQAEKCLERLAKERENLGFIAEITLSEWKKGALNVQ